MTAPSYADITDIVCPWCGCMDGGGIASASSEAPKANTCPHCGGVYSAQVKMRPIFEMHGLHAPRPRRGSRYTGKLANSIEDTNA